MLYYIKLYYRQYIVLYILITLHIIHIVYICMSLYVLGVQEAIIIRMANLNHQRLIPLLPCECLWIVDSTGPGTWYPTDMMHVIFEELRMHKFNQIHSLKPKLGNLTFFSPWNCWSPTGRKNFQLHPFASLKLWHSLHPGPWPAIHRLSTRSL